MEYPKYEGNYLGIVVQNNDPERRGRVKVFVPHITPTVYKKWVSENDDLSFKFIGENIKSDLSVVIDELKSILPWANLALPIAGESASGRYNDTLKSGTTSDTSFFNALTANSENAARAAANQDGTGDKPGAIFDQNAYMLADAFNNPAETNVNRVNKLSFNYKPETYSNRAKGAFAIPRVGAHVWVFFNNGDPMAPVVFAAAYGETDWCGIYDVTADDLGQDYPGEYENFNEKDKPLSSTGSGSQYTINEETYRNKYVINQKGGTLAFVNTDNRELLKLTHFSGSFKEFNNQANIELAVNNDQKLVIGDSFLTIRGHRNEYTQLDYDNNVKGDHYRKVGDLGRVNIHEKWKALMNDIADIKQRFDIMRCDPAPLPGKSLIKLNSKGQTRAGKPRLCPVCTAVDDHAKSISVNNFFPPNPKTFGLRVEPHTATKKNGDAPYSESILGRKTVAYTNGITAFGKAGAALVSTGTGKNVITADDGTVIICAPGYMHSPAGATRVPCPVCGAESPYEGHVPGMSPSSYGGTWMKDPEKAQLPRMYQEVVTELAQWESILGKGGSEVVEIEKNKIENIGLVMNDWGSIRVDLHGKMETSMVEVFPGFTQEVATPTPLIEIVQVDDLPGGTYNLNVANKYNVLVGAGGVNLKSYGVVNISGSLTNIAGEQVNIGSGLETNIDGGRRLNMVGDVVRLAQRAGGQVCVDSDLGVTGRTIIKGALYVEGPIYMHEMHTVAKVNTSNPVDVSGCAYGQKLSPATPMGTALTSDTANLYPEAVKEDGIKWGQGTSPTYMGYNDKARAAAVLPKDMFLGVVPAGSKVKLDLLGLPVIGDALGITVTFTEAVPVIAKKNVTQADIAAAGLNPASIGSITAENGGPMLSITEVSKLPDFITKDDKSDLLQAIGAAAANLGAYIPGAGYGLEAKQDNLPLRGLPKVQREKFDNLFTTADQAMYSPIAVFGVGSDWDAIKMANFTTTMLTPPVELQTTNMDVRNKFMNMGSVPSVADNGSATKHVNKLGT